MASAMRRTITILLYYISLSTLRYSSWCVGATFSTTCASLQRTDAILLVDPQNCFMEDRPVRPEGGNYSDIPAAEIDSSGKIRRGPLQVTGSKDIVDVMNAWVAAAATAHSTVVATLDWHTPRHCSFCFPAGLDPNATGSPGIAGAHNNPVGPFPATCLSGLGTHFQATPRCNDTISTMQYNTATYFQWPEHCIAGTFGARFDPYLNVPADAVVIKLGVQQFADSFSAFDDGRVSIAGDAGRHDIHVADEAFVPGTSLKNEVVSRNVKRLFVMGLATDYVVKRTILDAIGKNENLPGAYRARVTPGTLKPENVILVDAGTRAVFGPAAANAVKADFTLHGGTVLSAAGSGDRHVPAAMEELCAGTCDLGGVPCPSGETCVLDASLGLGYGLCQPKTCNPGEYVLKNRSCVQCPAGFSTIHSATSCSACPTGRFAERAGQAACEPCATHATTDETATGCDCLDGYYHAASQSQSEVVVVVVAQGERRIGKGNGAACTLCPIGAVCCNAFPRPHFRVRRGYWRSVLTREGEGGKQTTTTRDASHVVTVECTGIKSDACQGFHTEEQVACADPQVTRLTRGINATTTRTAAQITALLQGSNGSCAHGYTGVVCGVCGPGFARDHRLGGGCMSCPDGVAAGPWVAFFFVASFLGTNILLYISRLGSDARDGGKSLGAELKQARRKLMQAQAVLKLMVPYVQRLSGVVASFAILITLPPFVKTMLGFLGIFNFSPSELISLLGPCNFQAPFVMTLLSAQFLIPWLIGLSSAGVLASALKMAFCRSLGAGGQDSGLRLRFSRAAIVGLDSSEPSTQGAGAGAPLKLAASSPEKIRRVTLRPRLSTTAETETETADADTEDAVASVINELHGLETNRLAQQQPPQQRPVSHQQRPYACFTRMRRYIKSHPRLGVLEHKMHSIFILLLLLVHPAIARVHFAAFICINIDDRYFLRSDLAIECYTAQHYVPIVILAALGMLIIVAGVPTGLLIYAYRSNLDERAWKLEEARLQKTIQSPHLFAGLSGNRPAIEKLRTRIVSRRMALKKRKVASRASLVGIVTALFKQQFWWWFALEMLFSMILVGGINMIISDAIRVTMTVMIAFMQAILPAWVKPYRAAENNVASVSGSFGCALMTLAMLMSLMANPSALVGMAASASANQESNVGQTVIYVIGTFVLVTLGSIVAKNLRILMRSVTQRFRDTFCAGSGSGSGSGITPTVRRQVSAPRDRPDPLRLLPHCLRAMPFSSRCKVAPAVRERYERAWTDVCETQLSIAALSIQTTLTQRRRTLKAKVAAQNRRAGVMAGSGSASSSWSTSKGGDQMKRMMGKNPATVLAIRRSSGDVVIEGQMLDDIENELFGDGDGDQTK